LRRRNTEIRIKSALQFLSTQFLCSLPLARRYQCIVDSLRRVLCHGEHLLLLESYRPSPTRGMMRRSESRVSRVLTCVTICESGDGGKGMRVKAQVSMALRSVRIDYFGCLPNCVAGWRCPVAHS